MDEEAVADLALTYLWEQGHRRIAHLAGPDTVIGKPVEDAASFFLPSPHTDRRRNRWQQFLEERGAFDSAWLAPGGEDWEQGDAAAARAVTQWRGLPTERRPTAVFCANDVLALAMIRAAQTAGWRVPQDISVVGVDNRESASHSELPLTTVDAGVRRVGQAGIETLLQRLQGASIEECQVVVAPRALVVRQSAVPPSL